MTEQNNDQTMRRLIGSMRDEMQALDTYIVEILGIANCMRRTHAAAILSLAEIEHRYVDQSFGKREVDEKLYLATNQLRQLVLNTGNRGALAVDRLKGEVAKLDRVNVQANRTAFEKALPADEGLGEPVPGLDYVDVDYFVDKLKTGKRNVQIMQADGKLPQPDAVDGTKGRPKPLWLRTNAVVAVQKLSAQKAALSS